jgi:hypothetical protein
MMGLFKARAQRRQAEREVLERRVGRIAGHVAEARTAYREGSVGRPWWEPWIDKQALELEDLV